MKETRKRKAVTVFTVASVAAFLFASCGGGGGSISYSDSYVDDDVTVISTSPSVYYRWINGTVDNPGNIKFVSAVYVDESQWGGNLTVPVRENTSLVNATTGQFSMAVENGTYALYFFNATGYPVGFVSVNGTDRVPYLEVDGNRDFDVSIHTEDPDGDGIVEATVTAGADFSTANTTLVDLFSEDDDGDGIPTAVDPDFIISFSEVRFLPVRDLYFGNDTMPANQTFVDGITYFNNGCEKIPTWGNYWLPPMPIEFKGESFSDYSIGFAFGNDTDNYTSFDEYFYTNPYRQAFTDVPGYAFAEMWTRIPAFLDKYPYYDNYTGKLTPEELFVLKHNTLKAIEAWNEGIRAGDPDAGLVYLGVAPHISGGVIFGRAVFFNTTKYLPPFSVLILTSNTDADTNGVVGMTYADWGDFYYLTDNFTIIWNGTSIDYTIFLPLTRKHVWLKRYNDYHTLAHELGHVISLMHAFSTGYGYEPSVMNYSTIGNMTYDVSDWDKSVVRGIFTFEREYGISDFYSLKNWWTSKNPW